MPPLAHARASASGAHRWMNCTASVKAESCFPEGSTLYADEGTLAHALAEGLISGPDRDIKAEIEAFYAEHPDMGSYTEMLGYIEPYVNFVEEEFKAARHIDAGAVRMTETKVDLSQWIPEGFGTTDVAIVADGSPVVLTAPYLFCEAFQVTEDYTKSPWYATFIRLLRFVSYAVALYLPALFVALFVRHKDILPEYLISSVSEAREKLPFSLFWEVLVIFLIFEAVREVGLRMPKAVGSAVGLVGSLILGDSAIKAGITSAPVLIVVALAAVCNFMIPPYMNANILYRFFMIVISGALGLFGFFAAVAFAAIRLCAKTSFGVPYLTPFAPIDPAGLKDFIYMAPLWKMKRLPISIVGREIRRAKGKKRPKSFANSTRAQQYPYHATTWIIWLRNTAQLLCVVLQLKKEQRR